MMSFDWKKLVGTVAPTLAAALGGPMAGLAVKAVAEALGTPDATADELETRLAGATPADLLALKKAEQDFKVQMKTLEVDVFKLEAGDRANARGLLIATGAKTPAVLSWIIVVATFGLEGYMVVKGVPEGVSELIVGRVLGTLDAALMTVIGFWLGTSWSSRAKDDAASVRR